MCRHPHSSNHYVYESVVEINQGAAFATSINDMGISTGIRLIKQTRLINKIIRRRSQLHPMPKYRFVSAVENKVPSIEAPSDRFENNYTDKVFAIF